MTEPIVRLEFAEELSNNRYVTEALTPEILLAIRDCVYNDSYLTERVTEAVCDAFESLYPELIRETNDDGKILAYVVLGVIEYFTESYTRYAIKVMADDLADAEDAALFQWKREHNWNDEKGKIEVENVEWVK